MDKKLKIFIENIMKEASEVTFTTPKKMDVVWDRNYEKLVDLVVSEECSDNSTCSEDNVSELIAAIRSLFYNDTKALSFVCESCGEVCLAKTLDELYKKICGNCLNKIKD